MKRKMTEAECHLVEENQGLVYFVLRKHFWGGPRADWEEYVQIGMLGLCRAAMGWCPEKTEFSTYASRCIEMAVRAYVRDSRAACRDIRKEAFSLDAAMADHDGITYGDMLREEDGTEEMLDAWTIRQAIEQLQGRDRQLVTLMMDGYSQRQIGAELNLSQAQVSRLLNGIQQRLRREVCA